MRKMVYLDNNATTPVDPRVADKMSEFLRNHFGNPSSLYPIGREAKEAVSQARTTIAQSIGAGRSEIVFTGSGTEADNFAVRGIFEAGDKTELIASAIEHPAVMESAHFLSRKGIGVHFIPSDSFGIVDIEALERKISPRTGLISVMHANNELGTIQPIREIVRIARRASIPVHTDAVQSYGKIPVDVDDLGVDLLTVSAHKIYGPKGVGALYIRQGTPIAPLIHGGHQEGRYRAGTENTAGIIGFGEAVRILADQGEADKKRIEALAARLQTGIEERIPKIKFNGHRMCRIRGTLNYSFLGLEAEAVLLALATKGIAVSTGSACSEDSEEVSHVLSAIGLRPEEARSAIRMSIGRFNSDSDVDTVLRELPEIISRLRQITAMDF